MLYYKDFREYLAALEQAAKLRRITRLINKDTEFHPLVRWQFLGLEEDARVGLLFENLTSIKGDKYSAQLAASVLAASRQIYALAMNCKEEDIYPRWAEAYSHPQPPKLVSTGLVKEEIHKGDSLLIHGGIDEFPIPMATNGFECLPRLTALSWHTKDPDTGVTNVGTYNALRLGQLSTNCRMGEGSHILIHWKKCRHKGIPLPAAAVVGAVPAVSLVSVVRVPYGTCELDVAGGIAGQPVEVVKCETIDMLVPASAEIVLEGEIPTDRQVLDGPSGEHTGYTMIGRLVKFFQIKAITHRRRPIWVDFLCQKAPSEDSMIRKLACEGLMRAFLRDECGIPYVKDVTFHHCAGVWRMCIVRMEDIAGVRTPNRVVWQALMACLSKETDWPKLVIAVDEDIDPTDLESVFWAVSFRYQPHRDTRIIQGRGAALDQSAGPYTLPEDPRVYPTDRGAPFGSSAILIDATRKWDYTPVSLPKREYMEGARKIWEELGFPPLKPKFPWYGYHLGIWPREYEEMAELAQRGEYDTVAQLLIKKGEELAPVGS